MRWQAYANASAQKDFDMPALDNIQRIFSSKILFILSTTLFCCGVFFKVKCLSLSHHEIAVGKDRLYTLLYCLNRVP